MEENGFAAAAKKQRLSTAAISRQITALEQSLKVHLLHRTTRSLSLTEIGKEYYQQCKKTLTELQEAENCIASSQKEATGLLHVLINRYFAEEYLLPKLQAFLAINPELKIKLDLNERFPDLAGEGIDIAFGISMTGPEGLVRRKVAATRYVLCASPNYLQEFGIPKTPKDLIHHRYITHTMRDPDNVIRFKNQQEITLQPYMWLNDSRAICESAIHGLGLVWLHHYVVQKALENKALTEILPQYSEPEIPVFLYYQKNRYLQPKIRKFIDYFVKDN